MMKIGSLFDGSGGFPLAGVIRGGIPVWRSEVEPYPVAVTKSRFPQMEHLGDVSKINGAKVKPVDVITFGSPCQDLSVAGKRAGLKHTENGDEETTRSGLFMEAVRIIKEMRRRTNGLYPTFAVWENVPGAFSSNKGEDFRIVLEELARIKGGAEITIPKPDKWRKAGCIEGDGWSIAWRTFDAQYWGVPQRRKRIYLVADFRGQRAAEILFECEGLRGYFEKGGETWKTAATDSERSTGADDKCIVYCLQGNGIDRADTAGCNGKGWREDASYTLNTIDRPAVVYAFEPGAARRLGGYVNENITGTLRAEMGDNQVAVVYGVDCWNQTVTGDKTARIRASAQDSDHIPCVAYTVDQGGGKSSVAVAENMAPTLTCTHDGAPAVAYGFPLGFRPENVRLYEDTATTLCNGTKAGFTTGVVYAVENHPADSRVNIDESGKCQTLTSRMGTGGGNVPMVLEKEQYLFENHSQDTRYKGPLDVRPIISATFGMGGNNQPFVVEKQPTAIDVEMEVAVRKYEVDNQALCNLLRDHKKKVKLSNSEIAEKLDVPLTKVEHWFRQDKCFAIPDAEIWHKIKDLLGITTDEFDKAITEFEFRGGNYDMGNRIYAGDVSPTLTCGCEKYLHLVPEPVRYIVRRLTPTECARLQGFPDKWGHPNIKENLTDEEYLFWLDVRNTHARINGKAEKQYSREAMLKWYNKLHTDSSEYKMWGNGIALPNALYVMQGIAKRLKEGDKDGNNTAITE